MKPANWREKREEIRNQALAKHTRLSRLFQEDRLSFERERKRMIDEFLNGVEDEEMRGRLRSMQDSWDRKMRHAGSRENRFVLARTLFWEHFFGTWLPAIHRFNFVLNGGEDCP